MFGSGFFFWDAGVVEDDQLPYEDHKKPGFSRVSVGIVVSVSPP
jgi:hypothetical protein